MSLAADWTGHGAPVTLVHVVPAGAGGVETVDDVAGVDVREPLGGQDLEVDTAGPPQVILEVPLPALANVDVSNFVCLSF